MTVLYLIESTASKSKRSDDQQDEYFVCCGNCHASLLKFRRVYTPEQSYFGKFIIMCMISVTSLDSRIYTEWDKHKYVIITRCNLAIIILDTMIISYHSMRLLLKNITNLFIYSLVLHNYTKYCNECAVKLRFSWGEVSFNMILKLDGVKEIFVFSFNNSNIIFHYVLHTDTWLCI